MDNEINEWLVQRYAEFERQFFSGCQIWRLPANTLTGTYLYALFETFARTFPDHPSDINTVFYRTESVSATPVTHTPRR